MTENQNTGFIGWSEEGIIGWLEEGIIGWSEEGICEWGRKTKSVRGNSDLKQFLYNKITFQFPEELLDRIIESF